MRRAFLIVPIALSAWVGATYGQSLGDVARQTRQKEKVRAKTAKKVITNEDIPESPMPTPAQHETGGKTDPVADSADSPAPRSALQWRDMILAQKDHIETMRAQINKLNASIHFVTANAYVNGAEYNQYQVRKQQEVKNLQKQLEEEWKKLSDMQEAARKEGMGAAVYDP
jgi:hypothetical protein